MGTALRDPNIFGMFMRHILSSYRLLAHYEQKWTEDRRPILATLLPLLNKQQRILSSSQHRLQSYLCSLLRTTPVLLLHVPKYYYHAKQVLTYAARQHQTVPQLRIHMIEIHPGRRHMGILHY
jgi:hypothetical protein